LSNFKVDGGSINHEPSEFGWFPKEVVGLRATGTPIYNPYRRAFWRWDVISKANWNTLHDKWDSSSHSFTMPAPDDGSFTQYTGCYIEQARGDFRDINVYNAELIIRHIAV
jgi:hypothetical protein